MTTTVQYIQDKGTAVADVMRGLKTGALVSTLTGALLPVLLYNGHSLTRVVALGMFANGLAFGGNYFLCSRVGNISGPTQANYTGLSETDPQVAPYLETCPEGWKWVEIDPAHTTGAALLQEWNRAQWYGDLSDIGEAVFPLAVGLVAATTLVALTAGIGRGIQGYRTWQSWAALLPVSTGSFVLAYGQGVFLCSGQQQMLTENVQRRLGRLVVAEALKDENLSNSVQALLADSRLGIKGHARREALSAPDIGTINRLLEPYKWGIQREVGAAKSVSFFEVA